MKLFGKPLDGELVIIAEVGVNHEGSAKRAIELTEQAFSAGADAVKFQMGEPTSKMKRTGSKFANQSEDFWNEVMQRAMQPIFCSALDVSAVEFCSKNFPVMKVASRDNQNKPLLEAVTKTGRDIILSTGGIDSKGLKRSLRWMQKMRETPLRESVVLMQCVSAYPVPIEQANVFGMRYLKKLGFHTGYSNHCIGPSACLAAVAHGASVIEVHFTDDKTREFRDHKLSFDNADLKTFVQQANEIRLSLGSGMKEIQPCEKG